jgi:hypothetical protein
VDGCSIEAFEEDLRSNLAVRLLRQSAVRMLVIDELHNVLAGRDGARVSSSPCCASWATN